jgi:hypothetical protein
VDGIDALKVKYGVWNLWIVIIFATLLAALIQKILKIIKI